MDVLEQKAWKSRVICSGVAKAVEAPERVKPALVFTLVVGRDGGFVGAALRIGVDVAGISRLAVRVAGDGAGELGAEDWGRGSPRRRLERWCIGLRSASVSRAISVGADC